VTLSTLAVAVAVATAASPVLAAVFRRPPTGVLLLAAIAPFDGLLFIIPHPPIVQGWKEALVVLVAASAWYHDARRPLAGAADRRPCPPWTWPMLGLVGLASASALVEPDIAALVGLKVSFFYLLVPLALWWVPLNDRELDHLVTILMATTTVVVVVGIGQQVVGAEALVALGYEYNTTVRFASGVLRSFSTFNQPFAYALYVMVGLLVGVGVALDAPRRRRNTLFLAISPILVVGLVTAVVRAALLGIVVGGVWLFLQRYRILAHAMAPIVIGSLFVPASLFGAFFSPSSLLERTSGWQTVFEGGVEPLGQGIGSVGSAAERVRDTQAPSEVEFPTSVESDSYQPDNYYVKTLIELGPIGAWLLLSTLLVGVNHARTVTRWSRPGWGGLGAGITASMVAAMAAATVSSYWEIFPVDLMFWMLLGVTPSLSQESSSMPSPSRPEAAASRPTAVT
jgi:hypothetical protein